MKFLGFVLLILIIFLLLEWWALSIIMGGLLVISGYELINCYEGSASSNKSYPTYNHRDMFGGDPDKYFKGLTPSQQKDFIQDIQKDVVNKREEFKKKGIKW